MIRKVAVIVFLGFAVFCKGQSFSGRIVRIIDGDALLFETEDSTFEVNLYGINAPDLGQTFYEHTLSYMENYVWAEAEIILVPDINREGLCAWLLIKGKNMNIWLVKNGYAWYNRPLNINAELARAEEHAQRKKLGFWISDSPSPPWDFQAGILPKPPSPDGEKRVLICTGKNETYYHKDYCKELLRCHDNVIVILREQARELKMRPCKYCY